jgi:hypothetical protein
MPAGECAVLSRRSATAIAVIAMLHEAARADAPPPAPAQAAPPAPLAPAKPVEPPAKPAVEPVDKDQVIAILGKPVTGAEGKQIGMLTDVLVDATGQPQAAVIDIGGFMGVGTRTIAVHWKALHFTPWDQKAPITLDLSLEQLKAMPEYKGLQGNKPAPVVLPATANPAPAH